MEPGPRKTGLDLKKEKKDSVARADCLVKISGIPTHWRAVHLRSHFKDFVEGEKFLIFHARGRKEMIHLGHGRKLEVQCCVVKLLRDHALELYKKYDKRLWSVREPEMGSCKIMSLDGWHPAGALQEENSSSSYLTVRQRNDLKAGRKMGELSPPKNWPRGHVGTSSRELMAITTQDKIEERGLAAQSTRGKDERKHKRTRTGSPSVANGVNAEEPTFSKGLDFALKLMERQGWKKGSGLGK